jgi:hypothetical protein
MTDDVVVVVMTGSPTRGGGTLSDGGGNMELAATADAATDARVGRWLAEIPLVTIGGGGQE